METVQSVFPDAPEAVQSFIIPQDFQLQETRVLDCRSKSPKPILNSPAIISREINSADTDLPDFYEITFLYRGIWKKINVKPSEISDARKLVGKLADNGIRVTTRQAGCAAEYFNTFIEINESQIPRVPGYTKLGWRSQNFILPTLNDGSYVIHDVQANEKIRRKGSRQISLDLLKKVNRYPFARLLVAANLAAPIVELAGCRNFIIDLISPSQQGKSMALLFANSLWAHPKWMVNFNATTNAAEEFAAARNSLPTNINEWQMTDSKRREEIANQIIHRFSEGEGRSRLNRNGDPRPTKSWHGIMVTTSEQPLTNENTFQGVKTRCLEIEVESVFADAVNGEWIVNQALCKEILYGICDNYGHLGPEFIQFLQNELKNDPIYENLRKEYRELYDIIQNSANNKLLPSYAEYLASITMADIRKNILFFEMQQDEAISDSLAFIKPFIAQLPITTDLQDAYRAKLAMFDYISSHSAHFIPWKEPDSSQNLMQPSFARDPEMGFYLPDGLWMYPTSARQILKELGFADRKILREWAQKGDILCKDGDPSQISFLKTDSNGKRAHGIRLDFFQILQNASDLDQPEEVDPDSIPY